MEKPLDVLIIDDDPEILKVVSLILKSHGHEPVTTSSEDSAYIVEVKKGNYKPDLILLDILLSGIDGRTLCHELKDDPNTSSIPIIMFSAYPNVRGSTKAAGANAFLAKPFGWRELDGAIKEALKTVS